MGTPLERAAGIGGFIKLRGRKWIADPLSPYGWGQVKAFMLTLLPDPVDELSNEPERLAKFSPEIQKALAEKALEMREQIRQAAILNPLTSWVDSVEGALFVFWVLIRNNYPEYETFESVKAEFDPKVEGKCLQFEECRKIMDFAISTMGGKKVLENADAKKKSLADRKKMLRNKSR